MDRNRLSKNRGLLVLTKQGTEARPSVDIYEFGLLGAECNYRRCFRVRQPQIFLLPNTQHSTTYQTPLNPPRSTPIL